MYHIKSDVGDWALLKTDKERLPRIITGISIRKGGVTYELSHSSNVPSWHYDFEIDFREDKNIPIGFKRNNSK